MDSVRTHYQVLGVSPNASVEQIRTAYRQQAKRYHPDRPETGDHARFQQLQHAYEVLCDPHSRRAYDQHLREASARTPWTDLRSRSGSSHDWTPDSQVDQRSRSSGRRSTPEHDASIDAVLRSLFGISGAGDGAAARRRPAPFEDLSYSDEGTSAGRYEASHSARPQVDYDIYLSTDEAARGVSATLVTDQGTSVSVSIPAGIYHGAVLTAEYHDRGRRMRATLLIHIRR